MDMKARGPEHSSARPERFLQLCSKDNMQVVNCTTPASIFHALRRQMHRNFRKPLIVMSPKSLLRHKLAISSLDDIKEGTTFQKIIPEISKLAPASKIRKVILCTGKIYYDLFERREKLGINDIAIIRVEQLYPFPLSELENELKQYPNAQIAWCQEEHENMGYFYFVDPRIEKVLKNIKQKKQRAVYIGRDRSASPAVGYKKLHDKETEQLLNDAFI